ncbi:MAG: protein kinase [Thermoanaerobaculia bacterium]|jgi:serine/threonine protein kinase
MEAGQQFGSYRLLSRIGAGGMGEVWKAEDVSLRRTVAIKILPAANAQDRESNERFKREARTAAQLNHPNIATIFAIDQFEDRAFIVMEFVDGEPLSQLIRASRLGVAEAVTVARSVAEALAEAHEKGIVHRDVKPDNIVVSGPRVKVLDFGIAKRYGHDAGAPGAAKSDTEFRTEAGIIIGTVQYMSPEQAMGKKLDGRSDIFSLGVVMYEAFTGRLPFAADSPALTLTRIIRDDPPNLRVTRPGVPAKIAAVVMRCLEKDPARRFQSARELAAALDDKEGALTAGGASAEDVENVTPTMVSTPKPTQQTPRRTSARTVIDRPADRRSSALPWVVATVALVIASVAGTALYFTRTSRAPASASTLSVAVPEASPAGTTIAVTTAAQETSAETAPAATLVDLAPTGTETGAGTPAAEETAGAKAAPLLGRTDAPATPPALPPNASRAEQADFYYEKGLLHVERRQQLDAYESFKKVVALEPDRAAGWVRAGELALFLRSQQEAVDDFSRAAKIGTGLDERDALTAKFGRAIAEGNVAAMDEACNQAPFDRLYIELRRMATKRGATDCPAPIGVGLEGGRGTGAFGGSRSGPVPQPRPIRKP